MKSILSERNLVIFLFIMVMVAFSFAHEDSKKRDSNYNAGVNKELIEKLTVTQPASYSFLKNK